MKKEFKVTLGQYSVLRCLLKATSKDSTRRVLTKIKYDHIEDKFFACDGHVLRIEKLEWKDEKPSESFLIGRRELLLTESQCLVRYSDDSLFKNRKKELFIPIEYGEPSTEYPEVLKLMNAEDDGAVSEIGITPYVLKDFLDSFHKLPRNARFKFNGKLKNIIVDVTYSPMGGWVNAGLIMPSRILEE